MLATAALVAVVAAPAYGKCTDVLPSAAERGATPRAITAADLIELRDIGPIEGASNTGPSPLALSPDGTELAFVVTRADLAGNTYCRAVVVMSARGGAPRVIDQGGEFMMIVDVVRGLFAPTGGADVVTPVWSPDGRSVGYRKRVGGVTQVWQARADGSGAEPVTRSATDVDRWAWLSNDRIVFVTRPALPAAERKLDEEALSGYRYDERVMTMFGLRPMQVAASVPQEAFVLDLSSGAVRPATAVEKASLPQDALEYDPTKAVAIAADGRRAGTENDTTNPLTQQHLWVSDTAGRKTACRDEVCDGGIIRWWWAKDGSLIFQRREGWARGQMAIYRWQVGTSAPRRIVGGRDWLLGCISGGTKLYCTAETSNTPRRIVAIDLASGTSTTLFEPNPGFARLTLGRVERIPTRNDIGLDAWSDLVLPPDYKPGTRLPLVIVQYRSQGFLRGGIGNDYPIFLLAQSGFAVLSVERPPVFGSNRPDLDTYDKLITEMTRDWAERKSILSSLLVAVDKTVARGLIDPARVGITGLSDGASTVEYGLINTKRFSAAAISSCCEDPKTVMTYGGITWADWNRTVRKYPLASEDGTAFWKPLSIAVNARTLDTPILMQLADHEYLGGLESFTALREQHNPVDLYVFPDEYHVKWQPRHRLAVYERGIDWFDFWLNGKENPDPARRDQYRVWEKLRADRRPAGNRP